MLTNEEKKFAYNKYFFNCSVDTILNFINPISSLDEKIERAKFLRKKYIGYAAIFYTLSAILSICYFLYYKTFGEWGNYYRWLIFASSVVPFVFIYNLEGPAKDVDNDLNNFIVPFLENIQRYIDSSTKVTLITDLGAKLSEDKKLNTETYADSYEYSWFSLEFPLAENLKTSIDLKDRISFYGKKTKNNTNNSNVFSELNTTITLGFVFKKGSYKEFDELKNCDVSWKSEGENRVLTVKTKIKREVEFYVPSTNTVGLVFDNNYCLQLMDSVYGKLRGIEAGGLTPETMRIMAAQLKIRAAKIEAEAEELLRKADSLDAKLKAETSSIIEIAEAEGTDGEVEDIEDESVSEK